MKKFYFLIVIQFVFSEVSAQWIMQDHQTTAFLNSIFFADNNTGYIVGDCNYMNNDPATILKSTDGGNSWSSLNTARTTILNEVFFLSPDTGYAIGFMYFGTILRTFNGGKTWTYNSVNSMFLSSIQFPSPNVGYAVGYSAAILKTTDGGSIWSYIFNGGETLHSVQFLDDNTGYAVGWEIRKTIDGGANWTFQNIGKQLNCVKFSNSLTGYIVGEGGTILKTNDGGANWTTLMSGTLHNLNSIMVINKIGYAVGDSGIILKTKDGGLNWLKQNAGTSESLRSVYFLNPDTGFVVGSNGTILKTTNGGGWGAGLNQSSLISKLLEISPNPASTQITIETPAIQAQSQLSISNISGQQLLTHEITEPKTLIDLSSLPSGVYFVRLTSEKNVAIGKFIKQ